jgi:hypothetical protein
MQKYERKHDQQAATVGLCMKGKERLLLAAAVSVLQVCTIVTKKKKPECNDPSLHMKSRFAYVKMCPSVTRAPKSIRH